MDGPAGRRLTRAARAAGWGVVLFVLCVGILTIGAALNGVIASL